MATFWQALSPKIFWVINNIAVSSVTFWLTTYQQNRKAKIRFRNRINCLHRELHRNFRYRGPGQSPLIIESLKHLIHEETILDDHPILFDKVHNCLCEAAEFYSAHPHAFLSVKSWENLMIELHQYISDTYKDIIVKKEPKDKFFRFKSLFNWKLKKIILNKLFFLIQYNRPK